MVKDIKYIIKRVIIGVLIVLILGVLNNRKVEALSTITYQNWQFVYRDNTSGQLWDNTFIYRLGEQKSLLAVNIYFPSFQGYYNGNVTFQLDPVQFPNQPNGFLTNQYFKLFVYQNGSYLSDYSIGTCDGQWTCSFTFKGTAQQLSTNNFSIQLLINNDSFSTAYIFYPAARISATVFVSDENNTGNQDIINNQNDNTQNIINNQNDNTQQIIESNQVCENYNYNISTLPVGIENRQILGTGETSSNSYWNISSYIPISDNTYVINTSGFSTGNSYCTYDINKVLISCYGSNTSNTINFNQDGFIRFSIPRTPNARTISFTGKYCKNGNQALNDNITDESSPDVDSFVEDINSLMPSSTPITDLLILPLTLMQAMLNGFSGTCSSFSLGSLMGTEIVLPCIDLASILGSTLWNLIDGLASIFMVKGIAKLCIKIYENITSLNDPLSMIYGGGK